MQFGGKILVLRAVGILGQLSAQLGGVGDLDLGKGTALPLDVLFPENHKDAVIEIILDAAGIHPAVKGRVGAEGHGLIRTEQTAIPRLLNHFVKSVRLVHRCRTVIVIHRHRRRQRVLRNGIVYGGRRGFRGVFRLCGRNGGCQHRQHQRQRQEKPCLSHVRRKVCFSIHHVPPHSLSFT